MSESPLAGSIKVGTVIATPDCTCEFTAAGHTDSAYPKHAIFRHTKQCPDKTCRFFALHELWFFDDRPIWRPGDVRLYIQGAYIQFKSGRARSSALDILKRNGDPYPEAYYSWKRETGRGVYWLTNEQIERIKGVKGWNRLRGPYDDLHSCMGQGW